MGGEGKRLAQDAPAQRPHLTGILASYSPPKAHGMHRAWGLEAQLQRTGAVPVLAAAASVSNPGTGPATQEA